MTQFTDFPNEIVAQIAQNVHPRDIVNFSSTSKFIHSVCEPCLKVHHEMQRKYKKCKCIGNQNSMAYLLSDIILHPTAALYVECLDTNRCWDGWYEGHGHKGYPQKMMSRLTQAVADTVPSDQVSTWTEALESGDEDPVLALLLLRLPGINTLKINLEYTSQCLFQTLRCGMEGPGFSFLSALTTLYIRWADYVDPECQAISYFATLPSLRSMEIQDLYLEEGVGHRECLLQPRSSNVTSIIIRHCSIRKLTLHHFLQGFKALRRFSCGNSRIEDHPNASGFDPVWVRAVLLAYCKASLEYLTLLENRGNDYMGSLREFENLKEVKTYTKYLLDPGNSERQDLAQVLPASIEKVHLRESYFANPEKIQDRVLKAAKDKQKHLPNLQELRISLDTDERCLVGMAATVHMQAKCEKAGFKLIID